MRTTEDLFIKHLNELLPSQARLDVGVPPGNYFLSGGGGGCELLYGMSSSTLRSPAELLTYNQWAVQCRQWHTRVTHRLDTPSWHTRVTHSLDTPEWHTGVTHPSDTPEWHTGVTHRSQPWGRQTAVTRRGWEYPPYHRWPDRSRHSQPATGSWRGITMVVPVHVLKSVSCYFQNWISSSYRERPSLVSSFKLINLVVWRKRQLVKENVEEGFNEIFASFISEFLLNFWSFIFHIYECRCFFLTS